MLRIAAYFPSGIIGEAITGLTGGFASHVAIQFSDDVVFEAVERGFVRAASLGENHGKGTTVALFRFVNEVSPENEALARKFCQMIEGKPYSYATLLGFPMHPGLDPESDKWICSEAVSMACWAIGDAWRLQRCPAHQISPRDICISPLLRHHRTITLP